MLTNKQHLEMFQRLSQDRALREWLEASLADEVTILMVNNDVDTLRKSQGRATFIQSMLKMLKPVV